MPIDTEEFEQLDAYPELNQEFESFLTTMGGLKYYSEARELADTMLGEGQAYSLDELMTETIEHRRAADEPVTNGDIAWIGSALLDYLSRHEDDGVESRYDPETGTTYFQATEEFQRRLTQPRI